MLCLPVPTENLEDRPYVQDLQMLASQKKSKGSPTRKLIFLIFLTRWAPILVINGVITPTSGVIALLITGRDTSTTLNPYHDFSYRPGGSDHRPEAISAETAGQLALPRIGTLKCRCYNFHLVGGFKYFLFSSLFGEMIQLD